MWIAISTILVFLLNDVTPASAAIAQYIYDSSGRLIHEIKSDGSVVNYYYDNNGNLIRRAKEVTILNSGFERYTRTNGVADFWDSYADPGI